MQVEFTVRRDGASTDVVVCAPPATTLREIAGQLAAAVGAPGVLELWRDGRRVPGHTVLGAPGLVTGAVLDADGPGPDRVPGGVLALHRVGGFDAGAGIPLPRGRLVIGRDPACDVVVADPDASRRHAVLEVSTSAITLLDCASTNGTRVDGERVGEATVSLKPGQVVRVGDSSLAVRGPTDVPAALAAGPDGEWRLRRPPRTVPTVSRREITVPQPSNAARPRGAQWVAALLPALAGGAIAWFTRSPQFLLFALLSPLMLVSTSLGDRLHWRRSRRRDVATYRRRRADAERAIAAGLAAERSARLHAAPDVAAVGAIAELPGARLWERRRSDADLLDLRLGVADSASTLQVRDGTASRPAGILPDVPYSIALRDGPLGVCGPREVVDGIARNLLTQLAVRHSPADVQVSLLLAADSDQRWDWARWLPHLGGTGARVAAQADARADLVARISEQAQRHAGQPRSPGAAWAGPWQVLVVDQRIIAPAGEHETETPGLHTLLADGRHHGISALCLSLDEAALPISCTTIVRVDGATGSRAVVRRSARLGDVGRTAARQGDASEPAPRGATESGVDAEVVLDTVTLPRSERLARSLAAVTDATGSDGDAVPATCSLLSALHLPDTAAETETDAMASAVADAWSQCDGGARTMLGIAADGPLVLDLVRDGPHALVAGTTGSGKSELLQSLVGGLAAQHPPDALTFLLVDYKGGAAFGDCARLPHTAGLVTDLDGYLTARALRSLHSELRRRERLFAEHGVAELAAYQLSGASVALPRLVIVVDEFAALAEELPDFVHGLIGVAQRGRSLGVHLVLATQRPRSAVSAEIRANTALRIALRVTDATESSDVIDIGDAAAIDRHTPGRAFLRTGDSVIAFQTAFAGSPLRRADDVSVRTLGPWRRRPPEPDVGEQRSELTALVDAACRAARSTKRMHATSPWLAPLPAAVPLDELPPRSHQAAVRVALVDLPDEQRRATIELDLRRGPSLLIAGGPRSGRTSALAAVALDAAAGLDARQLHVYALDPAAALGPVLDALPHTATVVGADDAAAARTVLSRLTALCTELAGEPDGVARLLLIDSWDTLAASLDDADAAECADLLTGLLRCGPGAGLTVVVSGGRGCLAPRFAGNFGARIVLALADRNDFGLAGLSPRDVPAVLPPGRGLRAEDGALVHLAHAGARPGAASARTVAERIAAESIAAHTATFETDGTAAALGAVDRPRVIRIRPLPRTVRVEEISARAPRGRLLLGVGGDGADPVFVAPFAGAQQMIIAGPPRSGRSTALRQLLDQARAQAISVVVAASSRSPLALAADGAVPVLVPQSDVASVPALLGGSHRGASGPPVLVLVDDGDQFLETAAGEALLGAVRAPGTSLSVVYAGRADDLATSYRGLGAYVRRASCGLILRPGPVDGEILGIRLPRRARTGPAGRGVLVGDPAWGDAFAAGDPLPVQVALPAVQQQSSAPTSAVPRAAVAQPMCG